VLCVLRVMYVRDKRFKLGSSRALRRLIAAALALVVADRFEPAVLRTVEEARYEDRSKDFRFENSDLFGLGPLASYLREHPSGHVRRVLFTGDSVAYGYGLSASDAVPGRYQRLDSSAKVFNVAINGFRSGSSFLIAKATIDSVDLAYVLRGSPDRAPYVQPLLPKLIPVDDGDLARFQLTGPDGAEQRLSGLANHWRLYRDAYRLQAAIFGASTRQYVYLNKGVLARGLIARVRAEQGDGAASLPAVRIDVPISDTMPDESRLRRLREASGELWRFGELSLSRRKHVVLLQVAGHSEPLTGEVAADFNRVFAPYARVLVVQVPPQLTFDGMHLTSAGAAQVARALWDARPEDLRR